MELREIGRELKSHRMVTRDGFRFVIYFATLSVSQAT
jgi:hypothetical protein